VQASNGSGAGPESAGVSVNAPLLPAAPTNPAASVIGNQATFTWTPPAGGVVASAYLLVASLTPGGPPIASLPRFGPPAVVANIPPGTYYVRVAGTNNGGMGPFSNEVTVTVAPPQPPGPPTLNAASVAGNAVTLSWSAPMTGSAPTGYQVIASFSSGGTPIATLSVPGLGVTVSAPTGTYFVRVRALSAAGPGAESNEITVVVP